MSTSITRTSRIGATLCMLIASSCAPYTQVQIDLVDQTRKGIVLTRGSLDEKSQIIARSQQLDRERLDDAFDTDARSQATLDANWVIEVRRAYAAGIDALHAQQLASLDARQSDLRTLDAMDEALQQLRWLQSIQLKYTSLPRR